MFHALTEEDLGQIIELQLAQVSKRMTDKRIEVVFTDKAKKLLAKKGYDPAYGARPLKRTIQDLVLDELALRIVEGKIAEGDAVTVDAAKDEIVIKVK
jgi:ATP-dependent Clp protease ATP-binding subunit ClpB